VRYCGIHIEYLSPQLAWAWAWVWLCITDELAPVSLPFEHPECAAKTGEEKSRVRGKYVSVERVRELEDGEKVEWKMATSSDAGGGSDSLLPHCHASTLPHFQTSRLPHSHFFTLCHFATLPPHITICAWARGCTCVLSGACPGNIPRFVTNSSLPNSISEDVPSFLKWMVSRFPEGTPAASTPSHAVEDEVVA
jgi:hypothetical protein